ncbi:hypothetical protein JVU11DRAFT_7065 [Chiua virens]|nr:hypothetical protein JVU11DRAFT_7065 [Chiua virens]
MTYAYVYPFIVEVPKRRVCSFSLVDVPSRGGGASRNSSKLPRTLETPTFDLRTPVLGQYAIGRKKKPTAVCKTPSSNGTIRISTGTASHHLGGFVLSGINSRLVARLSLRSQRLCFTPLVRILIAMFFRVSAIVLSVAACVIAAPGGSTSECDVGTISCCNTSELGVLDCSPISILGIGNGADCTADPVCCTNNTSNGLVNWECSPTNINL